MRHGRQIFGLRDCIEQMKGPEQDAKIRAGEVMKPSTRMQLWRPPSELVAARDKYANDQRVGNQDWAFLLQIDSRACQENAARCNGNDDSVYIVPAR